MTKIAQLHNGHEIHVPDETPDHELDAGVARYLGTSTAADKEQDAKYKAASLDVHKQGHLMARQDNELLLKNMLPVINDIAVNLAEIAKALIRIEPLIKKTLKNN